jgi:holo-[acyl-carrier protein] synthase
MWKGENRYPKKRQDPIPNTFMAAKKLVLTKNSNEPSKVLSM